MTSFKKFLLTLLIGSVALVSEFFFQNASFAFWLITIIGGMTTVVMLIEMIQTIRLGKYGVDILAITAIVATLLVGEYWASLMVLIMLTGGDSLEEYASHQASRELRTLLTHSPEKAHRLVNGKREEIKVDDVQIGDHLIIKPGEMVPVDGKILKGQSFFDESSLTGEARPKYKKINDEVMSGSINGECAIYLKVTKTAQHSQYQRLVSLVKESQKHPAHFVRLADYYAVPFTVIAYMIGGVAWFLSKDPIRFAEVLVVASPCPLILAAPVALVAGMARASQKGIVVKSGTTLEKLANIKTVAFDKTGTLTKGTLEVDQVHVVHHTFSKEALLLFASSVEKDSNHILARSLMRYSLQKKWTLLPLEKLEEYVGKGVKGVVKGHVVCVGKADFIGVKEQNRKQTTVYVSIDQQFIGTISFKDVVRKNAKQTVTELKQLGVIHTMMVTGDNENNAKEIAKQVGIQTVYASCLPEDKLAQIKNIPLSNRPLLMVGDGVNDAPALALADVGIAMGVHGSNAASESADAVILKDDITQLTTALTIAKETMHIAKQSVLLGIAICIVLMFIASMGFIPALFGAFLQEGIDTISILSALRAKKGKQLLRK